VGDVDITTLSETKLAHWRANNVGFIFHRCFIWLARARPPPKAHAHLGHDAGREPVEWCPNDAASDLQLQTHADTIYGDPEYSWDAYIHA
jgi:hypothetical protein